MKTSGWFRFTLLCVASAGASFLATVWSASPLPNAAGNSAGAAASQPTAFFHWLNVSEQQQHEIQLDDPAFEKDVEALRTEVQAQRSALAEVLVAPGTREDAVLTQIDRLAEAQHKLQRRIGEYLLRVRDHLSQSQRLQLMDLCAMTLQPASSPSPTAAGSSGAAPLGRGQGGPGRGMGRGRGRGMPLNATTRPEAATQPAAMMPVGMQAHAAIEALFDQHDKITRIVNDLPNGVRASTTSSDPEVARQIRIHVSQMKTRMESGMPMRRFDPLFRELFANYQKVKMSIEEIPGGVRITETSEDPQIVLLLRQHARTVSEFAEQGIARMPLPTTLPAGYQVRQAP